MGLNHHRQLTLLLIIITITKYCTNKQQSQGQTVKNTNMTFKGETVCSRCWGENCICVKSCMLCFVTPGGAVWSLVNCLKWCHLSTLKWYYSDSVLHFYKNKSLCNKKSVKCFRNNSVHVEKTLYNCFHRQSRTPDWPFMCKIVPQQLSDHFSLFWLIVFVINNNNIKSGQVNQSPLQTHHKLWFKYPQLQSLWQQLD